MRCVAFDPQNPNILASGADDETIKIWDIESGACQSTLRVDAGIEGVLSVSFSPEDNVIAAGCSNGKIYLLDALAGEVKSTLAGHNAPVTHCLLYTSPSPRDKRQSRMPSSA